jgi:enoyl-CoA hydratase
MDEPSIQVEPSGDVAVVRMARGKANALDTTFCHDIVACLSEVEKSGHRAVVLTGQGPIFSAGVDLLRLAADGPGYLDEFIPALTEAFVAVFTCPLPVVAAVNGHAIAGGCILACACDRSVMNADHGRTGVTELLVGVPFPVAALEIVRFAVGTHRLQQVIYFGHTYRAAEAMELGLVDEVASESNVLPRALEVAHAFAALPPEPLSHTRRQIRAPALDRISQDRATDEAVLGMWKSPAAQEAIQAYVRRVLRRA